jgi:hypothetical protein
MLQTKAKRFAANVLPVIREIQAGGTKTHAGIADKLNERRMATARGSRWSHRRVGEILGGAG